MFQENFRKVAMDQWKEGRGASFTPSLPTTEAE